MIHVADRKKHRPHRNQGCHIIGLETQLRDKQVPSVLPLSGHKRMLAQPEPRAGKGIIFIDRLVEKQRGLLVIVPVEGYLTEVEQGFCRIRLKFEGSIEFFLGRFDVTDLEQKQSEIKNHARIARIRAKLSEKILASAVDIAF